MRRSDLETTVASGVLVDTNVQIDAGRGVIAADTALREHGATGALAISTVTEMELVSGCRNKIEPYNLRGFRILPLTPRVPAGAARLLRT
jgi:predicted nucleic acid-binding protein